MKKLILSGFILLMFTNVFAQINKVVFDSIAQKEILTGECNREGLKLPLFSEYYLSEYSSYNPDMAVSATLSAYGHDYEIVIVMGSWCGDSKEQVPRFYKIMDSFDFPESNIRLLCVDKKKTAQNYEEEISDYNISFVPTFIFFRDGKELGRIIETPVESLEKDWLKIIEK